MTTQLVEQLKETLANDTAFITIDSSKWKRHCIEFDGEVEYEENEIGICTIFSNNKKFDKVKEKTIKYYLDNEDKFYNLLVSSIKILFSNRTRNNGYQYKSYKCEVLEGEDYGIYYTYEGAIPESITDDWMKTNIKLITINILDEYKGYSTLEFDFAVSWDDEHGLRALVWKDKVIQFAEGGYCWADTEAYLYK